MKLGTMSRIVRSRNIDDGLARSSKRLMPAGKANHPYIYHFDP